MYMSKPTDRFKNKASLRIGHTTVELRHMDAGHVLLTAHSKYTKPMYSRIKVEDIASMPHGANAAIIKQLLQMLLGTNSISIAGMRRTVSRATKNTPQKANNVVPIKNWYEGIVSDKATEKATVSK